MSDIPLPGPGVVDQTSYAYRNLFGTAPNMDGVTVYSGSVGTSTSLSVSSIPGGFSELVITGAGVSNNTATRTTLVQVSTDNGASYDTTAGNYDGQVTTGGATADQALATVVEMGTVAAAATQTFTITLRNYDGLGGNCSYDAVAIDSAGARSFTKGIFTGFTTAINAIIFKLNGTGSFDAGTVTVRVR